METRQRRAPSATFPTSVPARRVAGLVVGLAGLAAMVLASLLVGSQPISPGDIGAGLSAYLGREPGTAPAPEVVNIAGLRFVRTLLGLLVGAGLGVAGALIQAVTRNPVAEPGVLGINAGSSFAVALAISLGQVSSPAGQVIFAAVGALAATGIVLLIGHGTGSTSDPARLTLVGVAFGAIWSGVVKALELLDPAGFSAMLAWESGSFQQRGMDVVAACAPVVAAGLAVACALSGQLNALALGDDLATALGANLVLVRAASVVTIAALAGGAAAMAGPIMFVGLMVPHVVRWFTGPDYRWIVAYGIVHGPVLMLAADVVARVAVWPGEMPVGITTSFIGAPVLIWLVRRSRTVAL
ncbi:FecCD family ABC transporter permease [Propionibacterium australiense]|uniref:TM_ABC_iron-siderophores_like n=1 Tax=Propionibacterium australiense TaxID=119981 RepID=A0A383S5E9_9ACTN|nr:iron chelate uptake ABC transporter family permease subunit [Propionibacterium australiense]SYZ32496.1 TM_ABC_iron-siderophores_like [Propionibacterium australiense]VEH90099.1 Ferric enterobactin transport system permease protein fepD [Propionibacterium australiense]